MGVEVKCRRWVVVTDGWYVCCVWLNWNDRLVKVASLGGLEHGGRLAWSLRLRFASSRKECWQFSCPLVEWSKLHVDSFFIHFSKTNNSQQEPRNVNAMALRVVSKFVEVYSGVSLSCSSCSRAEFLFSLNTSSSHSSVSLWVKFRIGFAVKSRKRWLDIMLVYSRNIYLLASIWFSAVWRMSS